MTNRAGLSEHARHVLLGDPRQCIATSKGTGERCRLTAEPAQFVCRLHGGRTPLAQQAAREFLDGLREPALEVLYRATRNAPPCEHCGRSDADRDPTAVRAAIAILDRAGLSATTTVHVTSGSVTSAAAWIPDERLAQIGAWMEEARQAMLRGEPAVRVLPAAARALPAADDALDVEAVDVDAEASTKGTEIPNPPTAPEAEHG